MTDSSIYPPAHFDPSAVPTQDVVEHQNFLFESRATDMANNQSLQEMSHDWWAQQTRPHQGY